MENLIEMKKKEIQASTDAYILEEVAVQLKKGAEEELMEQYGLEITNIKVLVDEKSQNTFPENLQKVMVQLKPKDEEAEALEVVKIIEVNTEKPLTSNRVNHETEKVASLLSQKWNVEQQIIEVLLEGGIANRDG